MELELTVFMQSLAKLTKYLLREAIRMGIAYAAFFYVAHFTMMQSVLLALLAVVAWDGHQLSAKVAGKQPPAFEPFWIKIEPNWYAVCRDFSLTDVSKWAEFQKECHSDQKGYSLLRNGLRFTILSPTLFYSNDHHHFFNELDIRIEVKELKPEKDNTGFLPFAPRFYIKRSSANPMSDQKRTVPVFEFGLVTQDSLKLSNHPRDNRDLVPLAHLPEGVFYDYYNERDYFSDVAEQYRKETKLDLAALGWTEQERNSDDAWLHWPYQLDHKYVRITHHGISA